MSPPWALQCSRCGRFLPAGEILGEEDGRSVHYDGLARLWCGPVERVELVSEAGDES